MTMRAGEVYEHPFERLEPLPVAQAARSTRRPDLKRQARTTIG
jgi:hypothetical protein